MIIILLFVFFIIYNLHAINWVKLILFITFVMLDLITYKHAWLVNTTCKCTIVEYANAIFVYPIGPNME